MKWENYIHCSISLTRVFNFPWVIFLIRMVIIITIYKLTLIFFYNYIILYQNKVFTFANEQKNDELVIWCVFLRLFFKNIYI